MSARQPLLIAVQTGLAAPRSWAAATAVATRTAVAAAPRALGASLARCWASTAAQRSRAVHLGAKRVAFPSAELGELKDSTPLLTDSEDAPAALAAALHRDGYLRLRGVIPRDAVIAARARVLRFLNDKAGVLEGAGAVEAEGADSGLLVASRAADTMPFMEGKNEVTHSPEVLGAIEHPQLVKVFETLFGGQPVLSFDFKWLRGMHSGGWTGAHCDHVYMCRGSPRLLTCWIPLGDTTPAMGTVAVCEGSHKRDGPFARFQATYGSLDAEEAGLFGTGWFTEDPDDLTAMGGHWKTADFDAGDVLVFTMATAHMSTANDTGRVRLSCDTRWQPAAETADPRFVGEDLGIDIDDDEALKFGVYASDSAVDVPPGQVTMAQLRAQWGI